MPTTSTAVTTTITFPTTAAVTPGITGTILRRGAMKTRLLQLSQSRQTYWFSKVSQLVPDHLTIVTLAIDGQALTSLFPRLLVAEHVDENHVLQVRPNRLAQAWVLASSTRSQNQRDSTISSGTSCHSYVYPTYPRHCVHIKIASAAL